MAEIVPTILTNDISDFRKKYAELFALGQHFKKLHIDFADGKFVKNETVMPADLAFLKDSPFELMAHFMTKSPQKYFQAARDAGFTWVLFHFEAMENELEVTATSTIAKTMGLKVGLVINPDTSLPRIGKFITQFDMIQLMGIHPGFQGREFIPETIDRIKELRALSKNVIIAVDGGIKVGIAKQVAEAGADIIVAGSAILKTEDEQAAIEALKQDLETK